MAATASFDELGANQSDSAADDESANQGNPWCHFAIGPDDCIPSHDVIVVALWAALVVYGLVTNTLCLVGISKNASMRWSTSYWLIVNLCVCDLAMLCITLTHILPATLFHDKFVLVNETRSAVAMFFYNVFWYTGVFGLAGMAVNRFTSIMFPMHYASVFSHERTVGFIALLYLAGIGVSVPALFNCCLIFWDHVNYLTLFEDPETSYQYVDLVVNSFSTLVMVACYVVIILRVRKSRLLTQRHAIAGISKTCTAVVTMTPSQQQRTVVSHRELRLLLQFFVVSVFFISTFVTWQVLPRLVASKWIYALMTALFFINNGISPTVYIIFNSTLRNEITEFLAPLRFCCPAKQDASIKSIDANPKPRNGSRPGSKNGSLQKRGKKCRGSAATAANKTVSKTRSTLLEGDNARNGTDSPRIINNRLCEIPSVEDSSSTNANVHAENGGQHSHSDGTTSALLQDT